VPPTTPIRGPRSQGSVMGGKKKKAPGRRVSRDNCLPSATIVPGGTENQKETDRKWHKAKEIRKGTAKENCARGRQKGPVFQGGTRTFQGRHRPGEWGKTEGMVFRTLTISRPDLIGAQRDIKPEEILSGEEQEKAAGGT